MRITLSAMGMACCIGLLSAAAQAEPAFTAPTPLTPDQLDHVRAMGQAVLQSHRGASEDAEVSALKDQLHQLHDVVDQAMALSATPLTVQDARTVSTAATASASRRAVDTDLKTRVASLKTHRVALERRANRAEPAPNGSGRWAALASETAKLEQAVSDAVNTPNDQTRFERLAALRDRLRSKSWGERLHDEAVREGRDDSVPTPTLTTITQHR